MAKLNSSVFQPLPEPHTDCISCPIREQSLFQGVPHTRLGWTQQYREVQFAVKAKKELYREQDKLHYAYTLVSGWVAQYKTMGDGNRQILKYALPGDLLGFNLLPDGTTTHSADSITKIVLCAFPVEDIATMISKQPEIAMRLVEMNSRDMSICQQHLVCAGKKDARSRLAYLLLETDCRVRRQSPSDYDAETDSIFFPITQELLGDTLGLTNVHVNRMLQELKGEALINCKRRRLAILDRERLTEIAQFDPQALCCPTKAC